MLEYPKNNNDFNLNQNSLKFVNTRHGLLLMEQIASCVLNNECVLLVGETGNGKTAVIQHLSQKMKQKLIVQNLSQNTDSSDFLGGYKPMDLKMAAIPIMNTFGKLYPLTFANQTQSNHKIIVRSLQQV